MGAISLTQALVMSLSIGVALSAHIVRRRNVRKDTVVRSKCHISRWVSISGVHGKTAGGYIAVQLGLRVVFGVQLRIATSIQLQHESFIRSRIEHLQLAGGCRLWG